MLQAISQGTLLSESILSFSFTALPQQHRNFTEKQVIEIKHD